MNAEIKWHNNFNLRSLRPWLSADQEWNACDGTCSSLKSQSNITHNLSFRISLKTELWRYHRLHELKAKHIYSALECITLWCSCLIIEFWRMMFQWIKTIRGCLITISKTNYLDNTRVYSQSWSKFIISAYANSKQNYDKWRQLSINHLIGQNWLNSLMPESHSLDNFISWCVLPKWLHNTACVCILQQMLNR